jgi:simple sugar transport system ATP-binding protein
MGKEPLLKIVNVSKNYGRVTALKNVSFNIYPSEVVGLIGDNGAGKSTLIKIIMGDLQRDKGEMFFKGKKVNFFSSAEARALGIETVPQGSSTIEFMDITRNLFLGKELTKKIGFLKLLNKKKMGEESLKVIANLGTTGIRTAWDKVSTLSGGQRQAVSIGRLMYFKSSLALLDEPTLNLSVRESEKVINLIDDMKKAGTAIIFVTHNVYHVYPVADRFILLDKGEMIGIFDKKDVKPEDVIEIIRTGTIKNKKLCFSKESIQ